MMLKISTEDQHGWIRFGKIKIKMNFVSKKPLKIPYTTVNGTYDDKFLRISMVDNGFWSDFVANV